MNHIGEHMTRLTRSVTDRYHVHNTVCQILSESIGHMVPPSSIAVTYGRVSLNVSPSMRHVFFARKQELITRINNRLGTAIITDFE